MIPTWQQSVDEEEAQRAERKLASAIASAGQRVPEVDRSSRRKPSPSPYPAIGDFMSPELRRFWRI
jgi:hypothetical protein